MASSRFPTLAALFFFSLLLVSLACATSVRPNAEEKSSIQLITDGLEWQPATLSLHDGDEAEEEVLAEGGGGIGRRSLFWRTILRYYISYGALSANRIPCPPRSGRSYYTHNCYKARGPVHPYTRGCSAITRCRR